MTLMLSKQLHETYILRCKVQVLTIHSTLTYLHGVVGALQLLVISKFHYELLQPSSNICVTPLSWLAFGGHLTPIKRPCEQGDVLLRLTPLLPELHVPLIVSWQLGKRAPIYVEGPAPSGTSLHCVNFQVILIANYKCWTSRCWVEGPTHSIATVMGANSAIAGKRFVQRVSDRSVSRHHHGVWHSLMSGHL